ncbi:MAG: hypothetical protein QF381_03010 [Nitrososphaerales archaeon]|nr:hypothetical protein [Nitrososphaerales archaeon]
MYSGKTDAGIKLYEKLILKGGSHIGVQPASNIRDIDLFNPEVKSRSGRNISAVVLEDGSDVYVDELEKILESNQTVLIEEPHFPNLSKEGERRFVEMVKHYGWDQDRFSPEQFEELRMGVPMEDVSSGKQIIITSLDYYFNEDPVEIVHNLKPYSITRTGLAVCHQCSRPAHRTQMRVNGKPAPYSYDNKVVEEEGSDVSYDPSCVECLDVPESPRR